MEKKELIYEGKAKKVYAMDDPDYCMVEYKDDATAFNGLKKGTIRGKGVVNNKMSNFMFKLLAEKGIETHFVKEISDRETIRNKAAGSLAKKLGLEEGMELKCPILEFSYKNDELGDPMINNSQAIACGIATQEEIDVISDMAYKVNDYMKEFFAGVGVELIDFKLEFGKFHDKIILADEISPDTCRFWDIKTHEKLDKDRFRRDMGGVEEAYAEMMKRIGLA